MRKDIKKMLIELEHLQLEHLTPEQIIASYTENDLNNLFNWTNYLVWQKDPLVKAKAKHYRAVIKKCYSYIMEDMKEKRGFYEN